MNDERAENEGVVLVVDDDASVRKALRNLIRSVGLRAEVFESASDFLAKELPDAPCCLILDVELPGLSGLEVQAELARGSNQIPIIFITGHGDIPMSVKAMKAGAVEFLTKPFHDQELLDAVQVALERSRTRHRDQKALSELRSRFQQLTSGEQEVMVLITGGLQNKQIAGQLDITEGTVELHRGNLMRKMGAQSLTALVRMADTLGVRRSSG
jgi:FixJ family two-component response regulator